MPTEFEWCSTMSYLFVNLGECVRIPYEYTSTLLIFHQFLISLTVIAPSHGVLILDKREYRFSVC